MLVFIVIIFIFGWCLIRPLYKHTVEDQEKVMVEASLSSSNETKLMGLGAANSLTAKFNEDLAEAYSVYYDYMDSSEIDKLVTSYILRKGLLARHLTITMPDGYVSEDPYIYSDIKTGSSSSATVSSEETIDDLMGTSSDSPASSDEADDDKKGAYYKDAVEALLTGQDVSEITLIPTPTESFVNGTRQSDGTAGSEIYCVRLSLVVEGDKEAQQQMIDELTHNPSLRVTSFNWIKLDPVTFLLDDGSILVVDSDTTQLQLSVNLYMKDKAE